MITNITITIYMLILLNQFIICSISGFIMIMQETHLSTFGFNFIGASANINIWNPLVEKKGDFTTAQIYLKASNGDFFESIEAGWMVRDHPTFLVWFFGYLRDYIRLMISMYVMDQVHPELYGDFNSRLFAAWTVHFYSYTCFILSSTDIQTPNKNPSSLDCVCDTTQTSFFF